MRANLNKKKIERRRAPKVRGEGSEATAERTSLVFVVVC